MNILTTAFRVAVLGMLVASPAVSLAAGGVGPKLSTLNKGISEVNFRNVGVFQHNMLLTGDIQLTGKVGPLTVSDVGYGNDKLTVVLPALPFAAAMPIPVANPSSPDAALAVGRTWMASMASLLTTRIQTWANSQGVSMGIYNYTQEVNIQTVAGVKKRALMWNISVDKDGKATYGEPKLVNADPLILEANYVSGTAVPGLPNHWRFDNGGKIQYRVLDKKLIPITSWSTVNVSGVYDSTSTEPDARMPNCLIDNRNTGCNTTQKDIRQLLNDTGSSFAYINYVHGLVPEYDTDASGTSHAKAAISVDQRVWRCSVYENSGYFGFVLNTTLDRYFVNPEQNTPYTGMLLGKFKGRAISPTEPYSKAVPSSAISGHPDGYIISPLPNDNSLWARTDADKMRNVIYVAPVRSDSNGELLTPSTSTSDTTLYQSYAAGSLKRYRIGTVCDNCFVGGSGKVFDRTVTFQMVNPQQLERVAIVTALYDDWMAVWINGILVMNRPYGGDRLNLIDNTYQEYRCTGKEGNNCRWVESGSKYVEAWPGGRDAVEMQQSRVEGHNLDIKPYLRPGYNTIFMRTIVGGEGEGMIDIETNECGSSMGISHDITYPPPGASFSGVVNSLEVKAQ